MTHGTLQVMAKNFDNGVTQMVRTTMAIPIDIGGGQVAKINLPSGATLAGPVKVMTLPNKQTIAHVTVMAPPGVVEKYVAQAAAESEASGGTDNLPKALPSANNSSAPATAPAPSAPTPAPKPAPSSPKPAPKLPPKATPAQPPPASTAPHPPAVISNLFDKLSSKPTQPDIESKPEPKPRARPKIRSSSSESDNIPLSQLSSQKSENKAASSKPKPSAARETKPETKPQTGFGSFLEEKRPMLMKKNPNATEKEITKEAKLLWEKLDVKSKNNYIRNSEAYRLKKGLPLVDKKTKQSAVSSKEKSLSSQNKQKLEGKEDTTSAGYHLPKRNVKRKFFDVEEDYDSNDADWEMPEQSIKKPINPLEGIIPTAPMPPLKFKKKSKQGSEVPNLSMPKLNKVDKMAVNDDIDLPSVMDLDNKPSSQAPFTDSKTQSLKSESKDIIKESTPPPPLRKIESAVPPDRKANLKLICLHDGCFEEAKTESQRGKYWCSDKCCIKYTKVIFNAWVGARRANMIE